jgi:hypothetical protein
MHHHRSGDPSTNGKSIAIGFTISFTVTIAQSNRDW